MQFDFSQIMQDFAIPLEVEQQSGKDNGHYDDLGNWVKDESTTTLAVNEPLVPPSSTQMDSSQQSGGKLMTYDAYWYSAHSHIAVGTLVKDLRTGQKYEVASSRDYQGYSAVIVYGLKAVNTIEHI